MKLKRYDSYYDDVMMAMRVPEALHGEFCLSSDVDALEAELTALREKLEATREQAHEKADISLRTFTLDQLTDESGEPKFAWATEFALKDEVDAELTALRADLVTVCRQVHDNSAERGCTCKACEIVRRILNEKGK